ncbi:MAG: S41 family peptidase [Ginsengibacter sp.]
MKKYLFLFLTLISVQLHSYAQQDQQYFASHPTLTPDGQTMIYSYNGNLWRTSSEGGFATQITSMQGNATRAKVSPDGKWIAFSNSQFGNNDIYLMPFNGGDIKRLTFHSAEDLMESWSWDNQHIYFTSTRYDRGATYKVNINGGTPQRVFSNNTFDYTHDAFEHPLTGEIFFDDTWESSNFYNRIGYKGAFNPEIQSYNLKTKKHTQYTKWEGKDMSASIDKKGNIYFISDEANGKYNLYTFDNGKKVALTNFTSSIFRPFVNAGGDKVVFEKDFQIYLYTIATKKATLVPLKKYSNNTLEAAQAYNVNGKISSFDVSTDGKKLAFVSRGKLFVSDAKGKFIREIPTQAQEKVTEVYWLKDNKTLLYTQTNKGFHNLFTQNAEGTGSEKQVTEQSKNDRAISFNSDKTQATYLSGSNELRLLDLKDMKSSLLATDEIWGLNSSTPYFSPDDKYVMYSALRNFEQDILLVRLADKQVFNITNTGVTEQDPVWSPDGKYIYFTSNRSQPAFPYGLKDSRIYRMELARFDTPFKSDMFDSLFVKKETETPKKEEDKKNSKDKKKEEEKPVVKKEPAKKPEVKIDFRNMMDRLDQISPSFGSQSGVSVIMNGTKTHVLFMSNHEDGKRTLWQTIYEPFEKTKTEKIKGADGFGYNLSGYKDNYYILSQGNISKLNLNNNSTEKIDISHSFSRNLNDEFNQMFYEAWAVLKENYYEETYNGVNWEKLKKEYASFLPFLQTRQDIRVLLNDMMGELNTSHYGFSTFGSDESTFYKTLTAATGLMFENDNSYTIDFVVPGGTADFYEQKIQKGDVLVKVDGEKVNPKTNREFYFMKASLPEEMTLTLRRGQKEFDVKIRPTTSGEMGGKLYNTWEDANRQKVNRLSNNRIGYVHMRDMSGPSLEKFKLDMVSDSVAQKDALILDLRYNTGGNVHDEVLQFLSRKPYLKWKYRDGKISPQPNFAPSGKPIILLINEQTLSDGEMTAAGFKELNLGTIIGTETYRWIIFTTSARLVDGSSVRLPSWGCYTLDGKDLEKTGVAPDIFVKNTFEDRMNGDDPQIKRAIEEIMKKL